MMSGAVMEAGYIGAYDVYSPENQADKCSNTVKQQ